MDVPDDVAAAHYADDLPGEYVPEHVRRYWLPFDVVNRYRPFVYEEFIPDAKAFESASASEINNAGGFIEWKWDT